MANPLQSIKQRFGIIGQSEDLDRALATAVRVAPTDLSVLITGESGVGKEVFSKIIHSLSSRKHQGFIAINCGAIPEGTINSELFGHDKGAFTGATSDRKGYFETLNGGTIFLDEIGEMPLDTQAYLLRVLENGEFIRVGSSKVQKTDVRVIAATNVDLQDKIKKGKFREDLYYRLNTVPINVPSLKERRSDIYVLFRKFAADFAEKYKSDVIRLDAEAVEILKNYSWPGNIRELKNVAEQLSIMSEKRMLSAEDVLVLAPQLYERHLPSIAKHFEEDSNMNERDILYKVLFEMKGDLNVLKTLISDLIKTNNLRVGDAQKASDMGLIGGGLPNPTETSYKPSFRPEELSESDGHIIINDHEDHPTVLLNSDSLTNADNGFHAHEQVEENLSLEEMEKELICKALKKHRGRRKDAAEELGISERTLYRKIKQYELVY